MKKTIPDLTAGRLVAEYRSVRRWGWLWLIVSLGLALTLVAMLVLNPSLSRANLSGAVLGSWLSGLGVTLTAAIAFWFWNRRSLAQIAAELDQRLQSKNRLEALAELQDAGTNLARAQAGETQDFLEQHHPRRPARIWGLLPWVAFVLVIAHLSTGVVWFMPASQAQVKAAVPPPAEETPPRAEFIWQTPNPETTAAPMEELLTTALARSDSGLKDVQLKVSVNGEEKLTIPIQAAGLEAKGEVALNPSVYLDELEVEPFDMVAYWIEGNRIWKKPLPPVASKMQFVQVRKFRDDVFKGVSASGESAECLQLLLKLKLAQLRNYKENFLLSKTELPVENPVRREENTRVAGDQALLITKTGEIIDLLRTKAFDAEGIHLLRQAEEQMEPAAKFIAEEKNPPALPHQGKALGHITEVEKLFRKVMAEGESGKPKPKRKDPFAQEKDLKKEREKQAAGMLENLARQQERLAKELNAGETDSEDGQQNPAESAKEWQGNQEERQRKISQQLGVLINGQQLPPPAQEALAEASSEAIKSLQGLEQKDPALSREPATLAASRLREAVRLMESGGEARADIAMSEAQKAMDRLSREMDKMAGEPSSGQQQSAKAEEVQRQIEEQKDRLAEAAEEQMKTGSGKAAERLAELAKTFDQSKAGEKASEAAQGNNPAAGKEAAKQVSDLADAAARARLRKAPDAEQVRKWTAKLEQDRATLKRLAAKAGSAGNPPEQAGSKSGEKGTEQGGSKPGEKAGGNGDKPGESNQDGKGASDKPGDRPGQQAGTQGTGDKPGEQSPGQGPGNEPGQQSGGQGAGEQPGDQPAAEQAANSRPATEVSPSSSQGSGTRGRNGAGRMSDEIVNDIRELSRITGVVYPEAFESDRPGERLKRVLNKLDEDVSVVVVYESIDAPLADFIALLDAKLAALKRDHELIAANPDEAPEAYRGAVSRYFETLSANFERAEKAEPEPAAR